MNAIETISGPVSYLDRANVDTDQIMPKQFLKRVERSGFGQFLFYDWAKEPDWNLPARPILVAGENFGCGSSREHAPWGLQDYGFDALVAPSFADIFYSNCTKIGLLPVVLSEEHCRALAAAGEGQVDLRAQEVRYPGLDGQLVSVAFEIDPETRRRLLEGLDDIAVTLSHEERIAQYEAAHAGGSEPTGSSPASPSRPGGWMGVETTAL
jgi:3-isopropylmalate/(R)-2-methylmalate dehydratase small subunit